MAILPTAREHRAWVKCVKAGFTLKGFFEWVSILGDYNQALVNNNTSDWIEANQGKAIEIDKTS